MSTDIEAIDSRVELAKARVLERIMSTTGARYKPGKQSFWTRRLALPLPALIAAMALLAVLGLALFQSQGRNAELRLAIQKAGEMPASSIIPGNMDSILQYLSSQNNGVSVIFTLPSGTNMAEQGEPMIIREADWRAGGRE